MLPTMMLQLTELANFEPPAGGRSLLSERQATPVAGFAALLDLGIEAAQPLVLDRGQPLPVAGKPLPLEPDARGSVVVPDASGSLIQPLPADAAADAVNLLVPIPSLPAPPSGGKPGSAAAGAAGEAPASAPPRPQAAVDTILPDGRAQRPERVAIAAAGVFSGGDAPVPPHSGPPLSGPQPTDAATAAGLSSRPPGPAQPVHLLPAEAFREQLPPQAGQPARVPERDAAKATATAALRLEEAGGPDLPGGFQRPAPRPAATEARGAMAPAPAPMAGVAPGVEAVDAQPAPLAAAGAAQPGTPGLRFAAEPAAAQMQAGATIEVPVTDPEWGEQLSQRVQLMASHRLQTAELRLTPAELGPLRIQVTVDDAAASVTFQAQHAVTREAIEQALPRLREMLADSGLTLAQSSVGEQGVADGRREPDGGGATADVATAEVAPDSIGTEPQRRSDGLVDTFA